jgi:glycopeptide antibiotics resistance protein
LLQLKFIVSGEQSMNSDPTQAYGMLAAIAGVYMVFLILIMAAIIFPFWFILKKAGFSPWLSLINIIPFGTLVLLYILAFGEWKVIPAPLAQLPWQPPQPPFPPQV